MGIIVYVETNFLMSVAMGREAQGGELLSSISAEVQVAIPSSCLLESLAAFEGEQKRRHLFRSELDNQITQLRRDVTSSNAGELLQYLEESRIANDQLLNDVQNRLYELLHKVADRFEFIREGPADFQRAVSAPLISSPTDNLILCSILTHASRFPAATKALLTENTRDFESPDIQALLAGVGISKQFRSVNNLLGWIRSQIP